MLELVHLFRMYIKMYKLYLYLILIQLFFFFQVTFISFYSIYLLILYHLHAYFQTTRAKSIVIHEEKETMWKDIKNLLNGLCRDVA